MKKILPDIHQINLGGVNAFLIDHEDLTLIDTGYPDSWKKISSYISKIGKSPSQVKNIIATHLHTDHTGSLADIKRETGAKVYMHPIDAELMSEGISFREEYEVSPGLVNKLLHRFFVKNTPRRVDPVKTDHLINDGDEISIGAGFKVIHIPGHCEGQVALLYKDHGGVLFSADSSGNIVSLNLAPIYEDLEQGRRDLELLSSLDFDSATFGHGNAILGGASDRFKKKFL